MNREFYAASEVPIIIPTVYRLDYIGTVKKLTKTDDPSVYIKMMRRAQSFTISLDYTSFETARLGLSKAKAFSDDPEDILLFYALLDQGFYHRIIRDPTLIRQKLLATRLNSRLVVIFDRRNCS